MKKIILFLFLFSSLYSFSQYENRVIKELKAVRITTAPKIDGKLNDKVWANAPVAKDFVMFDPGNGDPEPKDQKTEVKILYDDNAIYIGAYMYNSGSNKILKQLSERDDFGTADLFGISINPNNDGQNEFRFFVTAAGVQMDAQVSPSNGEDFSWNEVWFSKVTIDKNGWYAEYKLPYSALRFSEQESHKWGVNFFRNIEAKKELYSWNPIDKTKGEMTFYNGVLTGIENIDPPVRLGFFPFASIVYGTYDGDSETDYNFGMDIKYGITDNFTLLATLIPDFSQVGFDDITLNLSPFEQRFDEQRQFFIEGADLLSKGDLFFSRRIGNRPVGYRKVWDIVRENDNMEVVDNPHEVDVLNAVKVTGRTKKGLGIAFLNAITKKTEATLKDLTTDEKIKVVTEPLANYNVLVIDQEFHKNSSIGITNTSVIRNGEFRDANVTALIFNLANKANSYKLSGQGSTSYIKENGESTVGYASDLEFSKTKGHVRYSLSHKLADDKYDKNDLGFQRRDNYSYFFANINYRIFKPTAHFNDIILGVFLGYFSRFKPYVYTGNFINFFGKATTKKQLSFGGRIGTNIGKSKDFFEPRTEGRYWLENPSTEIKAYLSSDYRKKFAVDFGFNTNWFYGNDEYGYGFEVSPRYRINDKLMFTYAFSFDESENELGYVTTLPDESIIFGKRENIEVENSISGKYSFNDRSSLTLAFRHYWSPVTYQDQYYELQDDGMLDESDYTGNNNLNFNSWNLDLRYIWEFSRGSQLVVLYRNSILDFNHKSDHSFQENISDLFDQPFGHTISAKFIYFLNYNNMRS
ncbi:MAG: hypothetical protein DSY82_05895 [Flavobacteriia bacterium]|nr:MAG: hypothetical protein DSY82_05895 [Flavobacteriia bacterium]